MDLLHMADHMHDPRILVANGLSEMACRTRGRQWRTVQDRLDSRSMLPWIYCRNSMSE